MTKILKSKAFQYRKSYKIGNWGCQFDSLLELKYAISIQDEYEFLRARVTIFYHHGTKAPKGYVREGVLRYTPDFLIRHKQTREASLVEIKPRAAQFDPQLQLRKEVAENFIRWKNYDWKFKVVFDDEIILDEAALEIFNDCCALRSKSSSRLWLAQQDQHYNQHAPTFFAKPPCERDIRFVMFGEQGQ